MGECGVDCDGDGEDCDVNFECDFDLMLSD